MADVETEVKKWGNSLGVRLPRTLLDAEGIRPGDLVHVRVEKAQTANPAAWGILAQSSTGRGSTREFEAFRRRERAQASARERRLG